MQVVVRDTDRYFSNVSNVRVPQTIRTVVIFLKCFLIVFMYMTDTKILQVYFLSVNTLSFNTYILHHLTVLIVKILDFRTGMK